MRKYIYLIIFESFKVTHYLTYCWTFIHITWWFLWDLFWRLYWLIRLLTFERIRINWWINRIYIVIPFIWSHHVIKWRKLLWLLNLTWRNIWRLIVLRTLIQIRNSLIRIYIVIYWNLVSKTTLITSKTLVSTKSTLVSSKSLISPKPLITTKTLIPSKSLIAPKTLVSKVSSSSKSLTSLTSLTKIIVSRLTTSFNIIFKLLG